jgi:hypothetical protein
VTAPRALARSHSGDAGKLSVDHDSFCMESPRLAGAVKGPWGRQRAAAYAIDLR